LDNKQKYKIIKIQTDNERMIAVDNGKFRVWTKGGCGDIKILLLHGGPSATSEYFECFEQFLSPDEFEFYY